MNVGSEVIYGPLAPKIVLNFNKYHILHIYYHIRFVIFKYFENSVGAQILSFVIRYISVYFVLCI